LCPLAVETVESRRAAGRFLRRRRRSCRVLSRLRQHAGFMVPGPVQHAGAVALGEDSHVERQRAIYLARLERFAEILSQSGIDARLPSGSFYLWVAVPKGFEPHGGAGEANPAWALTRWLAGHGGVLVAPGDTYGRPGPAMCVSRSCSRTIASSSSPAGCTRRGSAEQLRSEQIEDLIQRGARRAVLEVSEVLCQHRVGTFSVALRVAGSRVDLDRDKGVPSSSRSLAKR